MLGDASPFLRKAAQRAGSAGLREHRASRASAQAATRRDLPGHHRRRPRSLTTLAGAAGTGLTMVASRCTHASSASAFSSCAYRKSNPDVFVMQSAEDRAAKNTPCPLYGARSGSILVQSQVRARLIIVASVRFQNPA
jgi:hypothetical protein